jgi:O-antigen/teichoic acid export membrane protein
MSIARNSGYNLAGAAASMIVSIACVPIYLAAIGIERFGLLALCWLFATLTTFLSLGIGPALAQRLAGMGDAPDEDRADAFWSAVWLTILIGAIAASLFLLVAEANFEAGAAAHGTLSNEMHDALPWLALMLPAVILGEVLSGALKGREDFLSMNLVNAAGSISMSLFPLAFALFVGPRLDGLVAAVVAGKMVALGLAYWACARSVPFAGPRRPVPRLVRELASFGGWVTFALLLGPAIASADRFLIAAMLGAGAVSAYAILHNLVSRTTLLAMSLAAALSPRFTAARGEAAADLQVESVAVLVAILTPLSILLLMALGPFVHVWLGREMAEQATPLGYIFVMGFWMNSIAYVPYAFLEARGRPDLIAKLLLAYVIPYAALLYFGVAAFGVLGAAVATALRSFFDPTLFALAGTFRRVLPIIAPPALLMLCATGVSLLLPWTSWSHWAALASLLGLACFQAARTMPSSLEAALGRLRSALAFTRHAA